MSLNILNTIAVLESVNHNNFIETIMEAYGLPQATIKRVLDRNPKHNKAAACSLNEDSYDDKFWAIRVTDGEDLKTVIDKTRELRANLLCRKGSRRAMRYIIAYNETDILIKDTSDESIKYAGYDSLHKDYTALLYMAGIEAVKEYADNPADIKAAVKMAQLFDRIVRINKIEKTEDEEQVGKFLTRVLFCFFAENTGLFGDKQFTETIRLYTEKDGSNMDELLYNLFDVLNTREGNKKRNIYPVYIQEFPYVNGELFGIDEAIPTFDQSIRESLLECGEMNWSELNPDIFGSMFQTVTNTKKRGELGQHYTSYANIMKTISPLFLDELKKQVEQADTIEKLEALLKRLKEIKIFDPACGSGNFLITAYKELRALEMAIVKKGRLLNKNFHVKQAELDLHDEENKAISLTNFYGIEIEHFAREIAKLSLWLAEHQMNVIWKKEFGEVIPSIPLGDGGNIVFGNALRKDWNEVCPNNGEDEIYIIGNPPFKGVAGRNTTQREDMKNVFSNADTLGGTDFVACWFWKGAKYIKGTEAELALISTNSICQAEQVYRLWDPLLSLGIDIKFAYTSFPWSNSAKCRNAGVTVVVVGLTNRIDGYQKKLYHSEGDKLVVECVSNISPYLIEGSNQIVRPASDPIWDGAPRLTSGSEPREGGHLFINSREEYNQLIEKEPKAKRWIRKMLGSEEFINGKERWCLWMARGDLDELMMLPEISRRLSAIAELRRNSERPSTIRSAATPHLFSQISQPTKGEYLIIPRVSSERRKYIPIGFLTHDVIATDRVNIVPNATVYDFAMVTSLMHNEWVKLVGGKLKNDTSYSSRLCYNAFPFPEASEDQRNVIEDLGWEILDIRATYPEKTLAELYDPDLMPEDLREAHHMLDKAVEELYQTGGFENEKERLTHLLNRYEMLTKGKE